MVWGDKLCHFPDTITANLQVMIVSFVIVTYFYFFEHNLNKILEYATPKFNVKEWSHPCPLRWAHHLAHPNRLA
jgi:hypothetical protein